MESEWILSQNLEDGRVFDVEMQNRKEGNIPKRTRFYQALMDAPLLKSGEKGFDKLKPLFIIVICDYDPYGTKKYCYTFESRCKEQPDLLLGDEVTKLFLSTKGENEDEVSKELVDFLHYITESNERGLPEECDERLRRLHESIQEMKNKYKCGGRVYEDGRKRKTGKRRGNRARFKRRENTRKRGRKIVLRRWRIWNIVRNCMRNLAYKLEKRSFYGRNPVEAFLSMSLKYNEL